ncbi:hypothetical protein MMC20_003396 [Loxospora ochrophaea]|nr:hypothetical protein [Loxospora ochrophaea]
MGTVAASFPRISPVAFTGTIFTFLGVAILAAASRTILRIRQFHSIDVDDGFLILSVIAFSAGTGVVYLARDTMYLQSEVMLHMVDPATIPNFRDQMLYSQKLNESSSVLIWTAIFAVKFSFVFFFQTCTASSLVTREAIYLDATVCIDVVTDILVISIPTALLWKVSLDFHRKLTLGAVLCLSIFMIVIAIVRVTSAKLPGSVTDSSWIFFWQSIEAAIAIIMVSLTVVRSLFGQSRAAVPMPEEYLNMTDLEGRDN